METELALAGGLPLVTGLVYMLIDVVKQTRVPNRFLPVMAITIGIVTFMLAYLAAVADSDNMLKWAEMFEAGVLGAMAGGAAVGINQVAKQLSKPRNGNT